MTPEQQAQQAAQAQAQAQSQQAAQVQAPPPPPAQPPTPSPLYPETLADIAQMADHNDAVMQRHRERALVHNIWAQDLAQRMEQRRHQVAESMGSPFAGVTPFPANQNTNVQLEAKTPPPAAPAGPTADDIASAVASAVKPTAKAGLTGAAMAGYGALGAAGLAGLMALWNAAQRPDTPVNPATPNQPAATQTADPLDMRLEWWFETDENGTVPPRAQRSQ